VFVTSGSKYAKTSAPYFVVVCGLSAAPYFPKLSRKHHYIRKKKKIDQIQYINWILVCGS